MGRAKRLLRAFCLAGMVMLPQGPASAAVETVKAEARIAGGPAEASSRSAAGFVMLHRGDGSQLALMGKTAGFVADLARGQEVDLTLTGTGEGLLLADATPHGPVPLARVLANGRRTPLADPRARRDAAARGGPATRGRRPR